MAAILMLALFPFAVTLEGFVLHKLWGWFLVPHLGMPPISIPVAVGVSLIVGLVTMQKNSKEFEDMVDGIAYMFTTPLVLLLCGWVVTFFL